MTPVICAILLGNLAMTVINFIYLQDVDTCIQFILEEIDRMRNK